ncbi:MAG TPA: chorismate mutase [Candidatus Anaerostipes excrementavium]|uniref:Bifunctional chorismate mutase/prephenate dehydratase n=1 Tax=Candidatus Anaerostipes excrementavium TaxID=2838463 RepID=A0A9D1WWP2_9FIRM|nr:chorismate mutase [uncultured Anaerostipes sp.]HIX68220.1 chorismate mutase [Candidatus Anaerostipes excrementavium]
MRELTKIRQEIDKIDNQLVELFSKRMQCAAEVAEYKRGTGKAIYDPVREQEKLEVLTKGEENPFMRKVTEEIFQHLMSVSRRYQYSILSQEDHYIQENFEEVDQLEIDDDTKVVYQGIPGAYQEQAMVKYFGEGVKNFSVPEFKDVVKTLDAGEADYGVLPIENTSAGTVSGIYDMILDYDICVVGEETVECHHVLAALPESDMDQIKKVYSHQQGLMQCKKFLDQTPWDQVKVANTAISAKKVADDNDLTKAAICSERAAKIYGLKILKREVNYEGNNTTRFVIMSKKKQYRKDAGKVSISFSTPHESGSLYSILMHFMFNDVNMCNIESRPLPGRQWEYGFYVDVIGNLNDPAIRNALAGIREETRDFKILGNF